MVGVPCSRLSILKNSVPAAVVLFALGTAAASAYYTDMARAEDRISVAAMDFSTEGCGILADLAQEGQHLLPFSALDQALAAGHGTPSELAELFDLPQYFVEMAIAYYTGPKALTFTGK